MARRDNNLVGLLCVCVVEEGEDCSERVAGREKCWFQWEDSRMRLRV